MFDLKTAAALALVASTAIAPAARADLQQFTDGLQEKFAWTNTGSNTGLFNVNAAGGALSDQLAFVIPGLGTYNVIEKINGGAGATTTGFTTSGSDNFFSFTQAVTISYTLATPTDIDGVMVSNLLTASFNAGTIFDISSITKNASWTFSQDGGDGLVFTSDILRFLNVADESGSFSFSQLSPKTGFQNGFTVGGDSNYSSDPLPQVPEPLSAALLVVGMTAVGVASRRRPA
jgi:hypothetical protein